MPTNTPHRLVSFLIKPLVAELMCVEVMDFERAVVDVACWIGAHEEGTVVDMLFASIDVGK